MPEAAPVSRAETAVWPGELGVEIKHRMPALKALTSLRFFAAMQVVLHHLTIGHRFPRFPVAGVFLEAGYTGVAFFFVLSGFILAYNYPRVGDRKAFWISRFARVYPMYLIALLMGVGYAYVPWVAPPYLPWRRFFLSAMMLQTWYQPFEDSFNGPGWTLSVEAFLYASFPFLVGRVGRMRRWVFVLLCLGYLTVLAGPAIAHWISPEGMGEPGKAQAAAYYLTKGTLPLVHLPIFMAGIYLGRLYLRRRGDSRTGEGGGLGRVLSWVGLAGSLVLLCWSPPVLLVPVRKGLLVFTYAALIYGLAGVSKGLLTNRWMVLAGEISFSLYIIQWPVARTILGLARKAGMGFYSSSAAAVIVLLGVSWLAHRFVELPARVAIRNRLTRVPVVLEPI